MTFQDCMNKGLIKKSGDTKDRVEQSLSLGDKFLKSAGRNLEMGEYEVCEIIAYNAIFHYARALLFQKGYLERSHACLFLALLSLYPENRELLERADKIRVERHNLQYAGFISDGQAASFVLEFAKEFGSLARKLLGKG